MTTYNTVIKEKTRGDYTIQLLRKPNAPITQLRAYWVRFSIDTSSFDSTSLRTIEKAGEEFDALLDMVKRAE